MLIIGKVQCGTHKSINMAQSNFGKQMNAIVQSAKETIKQYCDGGKECDCKGQNYGAVCECETFLGSSVTDGYIRVFDYDGIYLCAEPYDEENEYDEFFGWNEVLNESVICDLADALVNGSIKVGKGE